MFGNKTKIDKNHPKIIDSILFFTYDEDVLLTGI